MLQTPKKSKQSKLNKAKIFLKTVAMNILTKTLRNEGNGIHTFIELFTRSNCFYHTILLTFLTQIRLTNACI